jgi:hypothetical protein
MKSDKKRLSSSVLDTCLMLCLVLGLSSAAKAEMGVIAHYLTPTKSSDPCSVINIHSLISKADGSTLYQQGQGWVTKLIKDKSEHQLGVVLPYHVVVGASKVYGECRGVYFPLGDAVVDAEADLAHLVIYDDELLKKNVLMPLVVQITTQSVRDAIYNPDPVKRIFNQSLTPIEIENKLPEVLNSMATFGVTTSPQKGKDSLLMSPAGYSLVRGVVDPGQLLNRYIRVENFGIRPGLSGGVLFGTPDAQWIRAFDASAGKMSFQVPLEFIPKLVLGMVVKTKLNGAETIAISLPDIVRFLEFHVISGVALVERPLEVHYHEVAGSTGGTELQSYLSLITSESAVPVQEICSAEFKQSADVTPLLNPQLKKLVDESKLKADPRTINLPMQLNDLTQRKKPDVKLQIDLKNLNNLQKKSGGGEYGEGGDGFGGSKAEFLTSQSYIGSFDEADIGFKASAEASSFGLYLKNQSCQQQGLRIGDRTVNTLALPRESLQRLVTYEDLRKAAKYGQKSADLLMKYARYETKPFFTFEEKWGDPLTIPLISIESVSSADENWRPGTRAYFKEKLTAAIKSDSYVTVSRDHLLLNTQIHGASSSEKMGWIQLAYKENQWQGRFALNAKCQVNLKSEGFKAIHPWLVEYKDGDNDLKIEMGLRNRLLTVIFQKVGCEGMTNLALGEVEVVPNGAYEYVIGSRRRNFLAMPIDLEALRKLIQERQIKAKQGQE